MYTVHATVSCTMISCDIYGASLPASCSLGTCVASRIVIRKSNCTSQGIRGANSEYSLSLPETRINYHVSDCVWIDKKIYMLSVPLNSSRLKGWLRPENGRHRVFSPLAWRRISHRRFHLWRRDVNSLAPIVKPSAVALPLASEPKLGCHELQGLWRRRRDFATAARSSVRAPPAAP